MNPQSMSRPVIYTTLLPELLVSYLMVFARNVRFWKVPIASVHACQNSRCHNTVNCCNFLLLSASWSSIFLFNSASWSSRYAHFSTEANAQLKALVRTLRFYLPLRALQLSRWLSQFLGDSAIPFSFEQPLISIRRIPHEIWIKSRNRLYAELE